MFLKNNQKNMSTEKIVAYLLVSLITVATTWVWIISSVNADTSTYKNSYHLQDSVKSHIDKVVKIQIIDKLSDEKLSKISKRFETIDASKFAKNAKTRAIILYIIESFQRQYKWTTSQNLNATTQKETEKQEPLKKWWEITLEDLKSDYYREAWVNSIIKFRQSRMTDRVKKHKAEMKKNDPADFQRRIEKSKGKNKSILL